MTKENAGVPPARPTPQLVERSVTPAKGIVA